METLKVKKLNEVFMRIDCEASVERELSDHFCFFVPGYKFMPAYKNRMWDGKIRLYDARRKTLYGGLYNYLAEFCELRDYTLNEEIGKGQTPINKGFQADIKPLLSQISLSVNGTDILPRDYQLGALSQCLSTRKQLLLSPTGSGKSLIIYLLMRHYLETDPSKKILIIVPTVSLVEQMYSDFSDYSSKEEDWHTDEWCRRIHGGTEKGPMLERCIISTWQSIYKKPANWFQHFGMVIGDEAHQFKAKSLTSIMEKCVNAEYRFGTTGTLDGTQTHQLVLEGLFGKVMKVTSTKDLQDKDTLAPLDIFLIELQHEEEIRKMAVGLKYQNEIDLIIRSQKRNNFIRNLAIDQKGNTLVLFQFVEKHGKILFDLINSKAKEERKVFFVSGATETSDREAIRKITEGQKDAIIVASLGTFSTGINIRNLHNIIFASPSKSQIRVLQSIGRGLRKTEDGRTTKLYDIADNLQHKSRKNYALTHAEERLKIYRKEKFNYKVVKVKL